MERAFAPLGSGQSMTSTINRLNEISASSPLPGLVWALRANSLGEAIELPLGTPITPITEGWYWLHFGTADARTFGVLQSLPELAPAARVVQEGEDTQLIRFEGGVAYGTIADLQRDIGGTRDNSGHLHFIVTDRMLITLRRNSLHGPGAARQMLQGGAKIPSVELLLETIVYRIVEGFDRCIEQSAGEANKLEDRIIAGIVGDARAKLGSIRRTVVRIHRHISGLRSMLQRLSRDNGNSPVKPDYLDMATRICQQTDQLDHEIVTLRERTRLLQEEVGGMLAEETNRHLRVLSVLTILFMPPTFIGGLFGMNLKGMMFADSGHGFLAACLLAVASSVVVALILRRSGIMRRDDRM